jgi:protein tyrosine phosphatase (PTP) superfamily phosphohydrolase (DUF442 family)
VLNRKRHDFVLLGCVLAFAGFVIWWWQAGQDALVPKNFGVVESGRIYRSGQIDAFVIEHTLDQYDIELIIDLAEDRPDQPDPAAEREVVARLGIEKIDVFGLDGSGLGDIARYVDALRALLAARDAESTVLVHCSAGSQRTGGLFAYYRLLMQGWDRAAVWDEYMRYRWRRPQTMRLPDYINAHMRHVAEALVADGRIDAVPDPLPVFGPPGYEPPGAP